MHTEDPAPVPGLASSSVSQPAGDQFLNGIALSDGMKSMISGLYNGVRNALYDNITGPAPSIETPLELVNDAQVSNTDHDPESMLGQTPGNHNSTPTSEGREDESEEAALNSKRTITWMTTLIVGVMSLIVVPGLILGFVTRQVQWGIALSGAIATVFGVFAGLYYHHNKRD